METFFEKEVWDQQDWDIYFRNLAILRHRHRLNKGDFNKRIGIWNAYRRDLKRPGRGTILSICRAFGVSEAWLASPHAYDSDPVLDNAAAEAPKPAAALSPEAQETPTKAATSDLISIFNDEKRAIRAVANLAFIETADPARFDEILEKIYGVYDNLKLKAAR
jgi:transcriptional regulator with XRE-family HTH domain